MAPLRRPVLRSEPPIHPCDWSAHQRDLIARLRTTSYLRTASGIGLPQLGLLMMSGIGDFNAIYFSIMWKYMLEYTRPVIQYDAPGG
jgi:hypothetical protein